MAVNDDDAVADYEQRCETGEGYPDARWPDEFGANVRAQLRHRDDRWSWPAACAAAGFDGITIPAELTELLLMLLDLIFNPVVVTHPAVSGTGVAAAV